MLTNRYMSNSWHHILTISSAVYWVGNDRRTVKTLTTPHISDQSGTENACKTLLCWLFIMIWLLVCNICSHFKVMNYCVFQHSQYIFSWQFLKYQYKLITCHVLQNVKQSGRNLVINWNDVANIGTMLAHYWNKIASELAGFGFWQLKLTAQPVNCAKWFLKLTARLVTVLLNNWCEI